MIFLKFQITAGLHLWQIFRSYMNSKLIRQFFGQWNRHGALCNVVWCQMWYVHALRTMIQSNAGEIMKPAYFLCKQNIMEKPSKITIYLIKMLKLLRALSPTSPTEVLPMDPVGDFRPRTLTFSSASTSEPWLRPSPIWSWNVTADSY